MKDTDIELELVYVPHVPHLVSMRNVSGLNWNNGLVGITGTDIWLPTDEGFEIIPLRSIEIVGREVPGYMVNQIRKITKYNNVLAIDYKKKSNFSSAFVSYTMLFAGSSINIAKLSNHLISLIGFKVDATFADLKPDESRLLCLIAAGIDSFDILGPIFDNNKEKLNHAFVVLKKKDLVDDYASTTQLGFEYVEQIKGKEGGVIGYKIKDGSEGDKPKGDGSEMSSYVTNTDPTKKMNKYMWGYNESSIHGLVATCELLQCIPIDDVDEVKIEDVKLGTKQLQIRTKYGAQIYIEPEDKSTIFILRIVLNENEDMQLRILYSIYLGVVNPDELAHIFSISSPLIEYKIDYLKEKGYVYPNNKMSSKGNKLIRDTIYTKNNDDNIPEIGGISENPGELNNALKSSIEHSNNTLSKNNTNNELMDH